jgi:hypothetical protein
MLLLVCLAACWIEKPGPPTIHIQTAVGADVNVYVVNDQGDEELLVTVVYGRAHELDDDLCYEGEFVARLTDGTEVERRVFSGDGFCEGDIWRINRDPSD